MPDRSLLRIYQALPLSAKVQMSKNRIKDWYDHWNGAVFVSFSGGKDSTVLAHIVRSIYKEVPLVFVNTGLEYPEIQSFARNAGSIFVRPKMQFSEVISKYGYPIISKENAETIRNARLIRNGATKPSKTTGIPKKNPNGDWLNWRRQALQGVGKFEHSMFNKTKWLPLTQETQFLISNACCDVMKKAPLHNYAKTAQGKPFIGMLAEESAARERYWVKQGCNAYEGSMTSQPLSFWSEQDILNYIYDNGIEIASVYGEIVTVDEDGMEYMPFTGLGCKLKCSGCHRTGCIFCGFGVHLEKGETRFQRLAKTHPKQYEYCMRGGNA